MALVALTLEVFQLQRSAAVLSFLDMVNELSRCDRILTETILAQRIFLQLKGANSFPRRRPVERITLLLIATGLVLIALIAVPVPV